MAPDAMRFEYMILMEAGSARLRLERGQQVWLSGVLDMRLAALGGVAWITFERNAVDVVICPGQSFAVPPGQRVLIGPLKGPVTLQVQSELESPEHGQVRKGGGAAAPSPDGHVRFDARAAIGGQRPDPC